MPMVSVPCRYVWSMLAFVWFILLLIDVFNKNDFDSDKKITRMVVRVYAFALIFTAFVFSLTDAWSYEILVPFLKPIGL